MLGVVGVGTIGVVQMFEGFCLFLAWVLLDGVGHSVGDGNHLLFASLDVVDRCWGAWCVSCVLGVLVFLVLVWLCISFMCGHGVVVLFWCGCAGVYTSWE